MTSTSIPEYTQYLVDKFVAAKASLAVSDVYYGDQNNIPRTPTICVDSGVKRNELNGAPRRVMSTIEVYVIVYHYKVSSASDQQKSADLSAEAIETLIHEDPTMGGMAIDSLVTSNESGYAVRDRSTFRASRLTIEVRQQTQLPTP